MRVLRFLRDSAIDLCLGCRHDRLTRPFTIQDESYMVCLDCGKQVFYSLESMRRLSGRELRSLRAKRSGLLVVPEPVSSTVTAAEARESGLAA